MKLVKKSLLALATAAAMVSSGHAAMQTVAGITWDPDVGSDFLGLGGFTQLFANGDGSILSGWGTVSSINNNAAFCTGGPGCQLSFTFDTFLQTSGGTGFPKTFSGGWVKFWSDTSTNATDATTAGDGTLWASFVARPGTTGVTLSVTPGLLGYTGQGVLDIVTATPGAAGTLLNTNGVFSPFDPAYTGGDLVMSNTINYNANDPNQGSTVFNGNSVPEPGSLALLGLGLVGLAAARRRKAA